jgi:5-deoxy-glucuronate isomerase
MTRFFPATTGTPLITPEIAGWNYSGLSIINIRAGQLYALDSSLLIHAEGALIPLNLSSFIVYVNGERFALTGREGVFAGTTDWLYLPIAAEVSIESGSDGEIAIATAKAELRFPIVHVPASSAIEIRGIGDATREIHPFMHPDHFQSAHRLMAVEVLTPDGNISSYPPHRHDGIAGCTTNNEEIYYFRIGKVGQPHGHPEGFGMHRTYSCSDDPAQFDDSITVHDGDVYLVPSGFHGPCIAMPGYPMYYLNILAGSAAIRTMDSCDDPNHAWIRESWSGQSADSRIPWKI